MNPSSNQASNSPNFSRSGPSPGGPELYSQTAPLSQSSQAYQPAYLGNSTAAIRHPRLGNRSLQNLADFIGRSPLYHTALFAEAPWFDPQAVRDDELIKNYVIAGRLSNGLPLFPIYTDDWLAHYALPDHAIARFRNETMAQARVRLTKLIYQRLRRAIGNVSLDDSREFDTWAARTNGEAYSYCENLRELQTRRWRGIRGLCQEALCFTQPLLRAEFRYLRKRDISFWGACPWGAPYQVEAGYFVPYEMVKVDRIRHRARVSRYVPISDHWAAIEVPHGCPMELSPVLTYLRSHLVNDPYCVLSVVEVTEFISKMAVFFVWDAYDVYRIWYLSPLAQQYARSLDLSLVLGSCANQEDFRHLLDLMDQMNWEQVPAEEQKRGERQRQLKYSPGRTANAGDFIWYDPWTRQHLTSEQAAHLRRNPRAMPSTQPTGYVYEPAPANEDVLMDEDQQVAYEDEPYEMEQRSSMAEDDEAVAPQHVDTGYAMSNEAAISSKAELGILRRFLEDVGIPSNMIRGDRDGMIQDLKLRLCW